MRARDYSPGTTFAAILDGWSANLTLPDYGRVDLDSGGKPATESEGLVRCMIHQYLFPDLDAHQIFADFQWARIRFSGQSD
jgi:hypothetical protein